MKIAYTMIAGIMVASYPASADVCDQIWANKFAQAGTMAQAFTNAQLAKTQCREDMRMRQGDEAAYYRNKSIRLQEEQLALQEKILRIQEQQMQNGRSINCTTSGMGNLTNISCN